MDNWENTNIDALMFVLSEYKVFQILSIENEVHPPTWDIMGMFAFTLQ